MEEKQHNHAAAEFNTLPRYLLHHAQFRGAQAAIREKKLGIWQVYTWAMVAEHVATMAGGLAAKGFRRGDRLAIIGDNRPRLYMAVAACQHLGGIPVLLYQDAIAQEMLYAFQDAEIRFAVVEDQEQVDKLLEISAEAPHLEWVFYDDPKGLRDYAHTTHPMLCALDTLAREGLDFLAQHPGFLNEETDKGAGDDISVMLYTSGTTGQPKGVCLSHSAFIAAAQGAATFDGLTDREEVLSYLPMAWVGDHLFSYAQALVAGFTINCPESSETVMNDLREIGPSYYFAPPRVFENLLTQVTLRMDDAGRLKKTLYRHFMGIAQRCGADLLDGKPVAFTDRLQYQLGQWLIFGPLKNVLGLSRIRVAYTAGAAIGPDLFRFFRSIGVNLKQFYGQTETCAYVCLQPDRHIKLDSVGKPAPQVEVKLSENGEILVKGPMLFKAYYKRPEAMQEAINAEGYFLTGDAGYFDEEGHLKIIDRAKDVGKLNDGTLFAPNHIENKLKFSPYIKEAVVFGHGRDHVSAMINIDLETVGNWAEKQSLAYSGYADLAAREPVYALIRDCLAEINRGFAQDSMMQGAQIHRFLILHKELDADDGELTRTRKIRRKVIHERYGELIDALYSDKTEQFVETRIAYEDGREGHISATVKLADAPCFSAQGRARHAA